MKRLLLMLLMIAAAVLGGCSGQGNTQNAADPEPLPAYPVTVHNYTSEGKMNDLTFQAAPRRVVVCEPSVADTLLAMGVGDRIALLYISPYMENGEALQEKYEKLLPHAQIVRSAPGVQQVKSVNPDLIIGWYKDFREHSLGNTNFWNEQGVPVYIEENSGPGSAPEDREMASLLNNSPPPPEESQGPKDAVRAPIPADMGNVSDTDHFPPGTVESEMEFLSHMGDIFNRPMQAERLIERIIGEIETTQAMIGERTEQTAMAVEFSRGQIQEYGKRRLVGDMIEKMGGKTVDAGSKWITPQELIQADPDVVFVVYRGGPGDRATALAQFQEPVYAGMKAVKNRRVFAIPNTKIVASAIHTVETMRLIRQGLYPDLPAER